MDHLTTFRGVFSAEEFVERLARVRRLMKAHPSGIDALLITSPENITT